MAFAKGHIHTIETRKKIGLAGLGRTPWNKGKKMPAEFGLQKSISQKGRCLSSEWKQKIRESIGFDENHASWKGNNVSYSGLHKWINKKYGKAQKCELNDGTCAGRFEWSNISREYKRDIKDFWQLCTSHHTRYDKGLL